MHGARKRYEKGSTNNNLKVPGFNLVNDENLIKQNEPRRRSKRR